jgi:hypothetical protein
VKNLFTLVGEYESDWSNGHPKLSAMVQASVARSA